ncbi:MAG: hypothetical protein AB8C84_00110 [Oligoflexales bacterium]
MKIFFLVFFLVFSSIVQADEGEYSPGRSKSLLTAIQNQRHHEIRKLLQPALLRRPADPNFSMYNYEQEFQAFHATPLLLAAQNSDRESVEILLAAGAVPVIFDIRSHILFSLLKKKNMESIQVEILRRLYPFLKNKYHDEAWILGKSAQAPGTLINFALRKKKFVFVQVLLELEDRYVASSDDIQIAVLGGAPAYIVEKLSLRQENQDPVDVSVFSWLLNNRTATPGEIERSLKVLQILTRHNAELLPHTVESQSSIAMFAAVMSSDDTFRWLLQFIDDGVEGGWWPAQMVLKVLKQQERTQLTQEYSKVLAEKGLKK